MASLDQQLRTSPAYDLARQAVDALERVHVWPTLLNFEIALHYVGDPSGPLATAVNRMLQQGDFHSDDFGEKLARDFLPRVRLEAELSDAGGALTRELGRVDGILDQVRAANAETAGSMAAASEGLTSAASAAEALGHLRAATDAITLADARAARYKAELQSSADEVQHLREAMERIQRDALTDPLTNLGNRRAFEQSLERACADMDANDTPLALAVIDIDHFKSFNDTWGHQTGDQVIRFIGGAVCALAVPPRMAARYGGEEFVVIMPRESRESALRALEELREEVGKRDLKRRATGEELGRVTVSIGVAQRRRGEPSSAFVERADAALYASKHNGRNRVTYEALKLAA